MKRRNNSTSITKRKSKIEFQKKRPKSKNSLRNVKKRGRRKLKRVAYQNLTMKMAVMRRMIKVKQTRSYRRERARRRLQMTIIKMNRKKTAVQKNLRKVMKKRRMMV